MKFTELQKKIIASISEGKIKDINSFINVFCILEKRTIKPIGRHRDPYKDELVQSGVDKDVYVPKDLSKNIDLIKEYLLIIKVLEKSGLIFINKKEVWKKDIKSIYIESPKNKELVPDLSICNLISKYFDQEIAYTPELQNFVNRNFLTLEEQAHEEEKRHRVKAQRLTLIVAIFSILGTMGTTLFQYFTYTNERVVHIKNKNAFSDTIAVKIIEGSEKITNSTEIDSLTK